MSVDKNVPEIRFKGFSEAWVDSDLKSFSDSFSYGLNASAVKFDGVNKYLRITDIDEKSRRFDYCQLTSPNADLSKSDNYLLKNGDILFARTGASVGKTYIYNEQDGKVYFAGFLIRASINHKASAQFIFQNTQTHEYARFVATTSQRSGQPGINAKEYGEYRLLSPSEPEQTQIGNYFQKLDALINQHQQKHDKFSNIKKAMLEKMFPKQGETIPEIRFKGFSGEWDEIELGEEVTFINGRAYSQEELQDKGKYKVLRVGNFYTNSSWYYSDMELGDKYYVDYGDLLYTWSASFGPHIWYGDKVIYHYHIWKLELSENIEKSFLLHLLDYDKAKILSGSNGSTMIHITKSAMEVKKVFIPKKDEQAAIGNYLQKLDALINQHHQQITKLNNIKQACLSKMFV